MLLAAALGIGAAGAAEPQKVLRYAFRKAETGFDPARVNDVYSRTITPHIFEGLYQYDPLARPAKVRPLTADGMPEHSDDDKVWTIRVRPGIYFAADPAFQGRRRELTAADYVYSFKRFADPKVSSPAWAWLETFHIGGLAELRRDAIERKRPLDYDRPIEGLRALDRYTLQLRLEQPQPRFTTNLIANSDLLGAVAREVVEFYGDDIPAHPVGTGPFVLKQWRRSSFIALERNPAFREMRYDAEPAPDDAEGQAILARLKGRRLPMVDRVEVSIIDEEQPRWLSFLQRQADFVEMVPEEFIGQAMPGGQLSPALRKQGVQAYQMVRTDLVFTYFNLDDPVVGGLTPDKVALRRAISLAVDLESEIRNVRRGQAVAAQSPVIPHTSGYDPARRTENSEYSPARAKALLDLYGYVDADGDGWRDLPDGRPLLLRKATQPDQLWRRLDDQWRRDMKAVGLRCEFEPAQWPENLKKARAGKLMMWTLAVSAADSDGPGIFQRYHSKHTDANNYAHFRLPAMDALFERMNLIPDGPERDALLEQAVKLSVVYMPYKNHVHRIVTDMAQPWMVGYRRPLFWQEFWQYVDIDAAQQAKSTK